LGLSALDRNTVWFAGLGESVLRRAPFKVSKIIPEYGVGGTIIENVNIKGGGFAPGDYVSFEIGGTGYSIFNVVGHSESKITGRLYLRNMPYGKYDVVVCKPGGQEARLREGLRVTDICGGGASVLVLFGIFMGLMSVAGVAKHKINTRLSNK